jgi:tetratricopeptide (TPR) repeat protein
MARSSLLHSTDRLAEAAQELSRRARQIESDVLIPDLVFARFVEFDFAPVAGAEERLKVLDEMLSEIGSSAPEAYRAEIEIRRAGQLVSLGRLDEALAASRRALDGALAGQTTSVYWDATATIALLVVGDRREEAESVVELVRQAGEMPWLAGFAETPVIDVLVALSRVGGGDPRGAAKELARSIADHRIRRLPADDGDHLALFAGFRAELGDRDRALELLEAAPVKNGHINWLIWPYVWQWDHDEFERRNEERRLWELERMDRASELRPHVPRYLSEEIEFWSG